MPIPHHKLSISLWKRCTNNSQLSKTSYKHPVFPVLCCSVKAGEEVDANLWETGRLEETEWRIWSGPSLCQVEVFPEDFLSCFPSRGSDFLLLFHSFLFLCGWNRDFWPLFCSDHDQNQVPNRLCQEKKQKKSTTLHIKSSFSHPALDTSPTNTSKHPTSH